MITFAPLLLCVSLTAEPIQTLTLTQTPDTLTVDDGGRRSVHKLDGSESRNMTSEGTPQVSTSTWEGGTLVTTTPFETGPQGSYVLRVAMSLEGKTLLVHATSTSKTTGAVFAEETKRYSK
jgi:hypothetical protein